jgi:transketolase
LPTVDRSRFASASGVARGGYVLADAPSGNPEVILIGTGSEVSLCIEARETLLEEGIEARVVSLPCWELFDEQDKQYRESVLPPGVTARVSVEQACPMGWAKYVGLTGEVIAMESYGASAPAKLLLQKFGFTVEHVVAAARAQIKQVVV